MMLVYAVWSMVVEICVSQYLGTVQSTTPSFVAALPGADYLFGKKTNLQVKSFVARYATFSTTVFPNYRYFSFLYIPFFIPCWQSPVSQWPAGAGDRASKANVLTWISCNIPIPENSTLYSQVLSSTIAAPVFFYAERGHTCVRNFVEHILRFYSVEALKLMVTLQKVTTPSVDHVGPASHVSTMRTSVSCFSVWNSSLIEAINMTQTYLDARSWRNHNYRSEKRIYFHIL